MGSVLMAVWIMRFNFWVVELNISEQAHSFVNILKTLYTSYMKLHAGFLYVIFIYMSDTQIKPFEQETWTM